MLPLRTVAEATSYLTRPEADLAMVAAAAAMRAWGVPRDIIGIVADLMEHRPIGRIRRQVDYTCITEAMRAELGFPEGPTIYQSVQDLPLSEGAILVVFGIDRIMTYNSKKHQTCKWVIPRRTCRWISVGHGYYLGGSQFTIHISRDGTIREIKWRMPGELIINYGFPSGLVTATYGHHTLLMDWRTVPPRFSRVENCYGRLAAVDGWDCSIQS